MKNIFKIGLALVALLSISSCSDVEDDRVQVQLAGAPVLKTPTAQSTFVLLKANEANQATTVSWDAASYTGANVEVFYDIEIVVNVVENGVTVQKAVPIITTKETSVDLTVGQLNEGLIKAELIPSQVANVGIRVTSYIGETKGGAQSSVANAITATPYPTWGDWGLIGSYIPGTGWGSDVDMTYDLATETYSLTIDLEFTTSDPGIKFRKDNDWAVNLGGSSYDKLTKDGPNLKITESGNYTITLKVTKDGDSYTGVATIKKN
ncbi:MAG: SusE domain-containing protein [Flavobacteriales bacterium]|nr:SusE domain-containing protein [Flavobacteriales bacterium]